MDQLASKEVVDHILAHHGVLGMKWGVRRSGSSGPTEVSVKTGTSRRGKTRVKTSGGTHLPAHPDAVAARVIKQKLKKSGSHALSNQELQVLNSRLNLEAQAHRLAPNSAGETYKTGTKVVNDLMNTPHGRQVVAAVKATEVPRKVKKVLATAATTAAIVA